MKVVSTSWESCVVFEKNKYINDDEQEAIQPDIVVSREVGDIDDNPIDQSSIDRHDDDEEKKEEEEEGEKLGRSTMYRATIIYSPVKSSERLRSSSNSNIRNLSSKLLSPSSVECLNKKFETLHIHDNGAEQKKEEEKDSCLSVNVKNEKIGGSRYHLDMNDAIFKDDTLYDKDCEFNNDCDDNKEGLGVTSYVANMFGRFKTFVQIRNKRSNEVATHEVIRSRRIAAARINGNEKAVVS